jgi:hypothetical protein
LRSVHDPSALDKSIGLLDSGKWAVRPRKMGHSAHCPKYPAVVSSRVS